MMDDGRQQGGPGRDRDDQGRGARTWRSASSTAPSQVHGGGGVSQDFPLAYAYARARTLRLADGPDEVHRETVAKIELAKHAGLKEGRNAPIR